MPSGIVWQILLLCIFRIHLVENAALQEHYEVKCLCGEQPNYEIGYFEIQNFSAVAGNCQKTLSAVCESHSCSYNPEDCASEGNTDGKNYASTNKMSPNPVKVVFPPLDEEADDSSHLESRSKLRHRRFPKSCNDSISPIRHAVMDCSVWPEFISCDINCTHGYATMEDGKSVLHTTRNCRESESAWRPKAYFPVCEPYIHCKAILVKPGDLDCKTSGPMTSYCDISCEADEDKDEVPLNRYECLDENFEKTLPHCATIVKDVNLIPHPQTSQDPQKAPQETQKAPQDPQKAVQGPRKASRGPHKSQRTQKALRRF